MMVNFHSGAQLSLHDCLHTFLLARKTLLIFIIRSRYARHMERSEQIPHEVTNTTIGLRLNSQSEAHVTRAAAEEIISAEV